MNSNEGYGLCKFLEGGGTTASDSGTTKWNLLERPTGGLAAGSYEWELYLVVGSLAETRALMDQLYSGGY